MTEMKKDRSYIFRVLESIYKENTLITVIVLSLLTFFGTSLSLLFPFIANYVMFFYTGVFIPAFVIIICLEILLKIRPDIRSVKSLCENKLTFKPFNSRESFENYLEHRLESAKELKIINMSSQTSFGDEKSKYHKLLERFINNNKIIERVTANTDSEDVLNWYKNDLTKFPPHRYAIYLLEEIYINKYNRLMGILIIDNEEVCLGGWYKSRLDIPTISIIHTGIVKYCVDYYEELKRMAIPLTSDNIDDKLKFPLEIINGIDNIYGTSIDIMNRFCKDSILTTGLTPNIEVHKTSFVDALSKKLNIEKENCSNFQSQNVISIRDRKQLNECLENYEKKYKDTKHMQRVMVGGPHFLDVFISDEKEVLIGIPEKEGIKAYTKCLRIKNTEATTSISKWFKNYLWNESIELIGANGLNEDKIKEIKGQLELLEHRNSLPFNSQQIKQFYSDGEFENYLETTLAGVKEIRTIHFASYSPDLREGRRYKEIIKKFIKKKGNSFKRIFCDSPKNKEVFNWIDSELNEYKNITTFFVHFLDKTSVYDFNNIEFMLIDKNILCLRSGVYEKAEIANTISISLPEIIEFFENYFEFLWDESKVIKTKKIDQENYDKYIKPMITAEKGKKEATFK